MPLTLHPSLPARLLVRLLRIPAGLFVLLLAALIGGAYYVFLLLDRDPGDTMHDPAPRLGPRPRTSLLVILLAAAAALLLGWCGSQPGPPILATRPDTLSAHVYAQREAYLRRQLGDSARVLERMRRAAAGIEVRAPERVTVFDTVIAPPETVYVRVAMDAGGGLQADAGVRADSAGQLRPHVLEHDVSRCDDGWMLAGDGRLVCNRARFGRLEAFGAAGARLQVDRPLRPPGEWEPTAAAGLRWTPCLRCGTGVEARVDLEGRASLVLERRVKLW